MTVRPTDLRRAPGGIGCGCPQTGCMPSSDAGAVTVMAGRTVVERTHEVPVRATDRASIGPI